MENALAPTDERIMVCQVIRTLARSRTTGRDDGNDSQLEDLLLQF